MITQFHVQNYKALRDVTLDLTPIHVLIGPNDSGKTSILEAIGALCRGVDHEPRDAFLGRWSGSQLVWRGDTDLQVSLNARGIDGTQVFQYGLICSFRAAGRQCDLTGETLTTATNTGDHSEFSTSARPFRNPRVTSTKEEREADRFLRDALAGVHCYRWNPAALALPVAPDARCRFQMEMSGFGLARCLDDILGYDRDRFAAMENRFKQVFPQIKAIRLLPEPAFRSEVGSTDQIDFLQRADGKGLHFEFAGSNQLVPASQVSDGVLIVLAYLAVLYLPQPPRMILIEEPENGIHPKRLRDVLTILRELVEEQSHSQVILTTHSPYAVDLFKPEEVTLCMRNDKDGSVSVRRLSESQAVREQADVFTLGEIWTAQGDEALAKAAEKSGDLAK